jgi:5-oxoprolinase (ATP-hydrolysing)
MNLRRLPAHSILISRVWFDVSLQHTGCSAARNQADNLSDLQAQIAANQKGIALVNELANEFGVDVVQRFVVQG